MLFAAFIIVDPDVQYLPRCHCRVCLSQTVFDRVSPLTRWEWSSTLESELSRRKRSANSYLGTSLDVDKALDPVVRVCSIVSKRSPTDHLQRCRDQGHPAISNHTSTEQSPSASSHRTSCEGSRYCIWSSVTGEEPGTRHCHLRTHFVLLGRNRGSERLALLKGTHFGRFWLTVCWSSERKKAPMSQLMETTRRLGILKATISLLTANS